jgi:anti-sigma factor RsiW
MRPTTNGAIRCIEVVEIVSDYLDRELGADEIERIEAHLEECDACRAYVEQMRQTIAGLHALPGPDGPVVELEELLTAFRARGA